MNAINSIGAVNTTMKALPNSDSVPQLKPDLTQKPDELVLSSKEMDPPEISALRIMFGRLTDDQVAQINKSGKLPKNAKFIQSNMTGFYGIFNNFFNISPGTQQLPEGYEIKKNLLGFAIVVPKGTEGAFIRK